MLNYTDLLTRLIWDIAHRIPELAHTASDDLLVFGRRGRSGSDGPFAACHCLTLGESEPGYYYWVDEATGRVARRSEWFVSRSPQVTMRGRRVAYLLSFSLPRFCDQSLEASRKRKLYPGLEPWVAKLDTVVHELYHIDPSRQGIRRLRAADGSEVVRSHSPQFFDIVARLTRRYLESDPDQAVVGFLRHDFRTLERRHGPICGTVFRTFPGFPQRFVERLEVQPACEGIGVGAVVVPLSASKRSVTSFTEADLTVRRFA